jgi:hypothetical protein
MTTQNQDGSFAVKLVLAWAFVGIPLVWGVVQTAINAAKLFQ